MDSYTGNEAALKAALDSVFAFEIKQDITYIDESPRDGGGHSDVYLGLLYKEDVHSQVAVKILRGKTKTSFKRMLFRLAREIIVWSKLAHENVLPLIGYQVDETLQAARIISPWMENGNVISYLETHPGLGKSRRLAFLVDTLDGLACLHSQGICHGDLKGANVLLNSTGRAVLCDFGVACFLDDPSGLTTSDGFKGSWRWASPEQVNSEKRVINVPSDVWAWGMTALEIMTGKVPFHDIDNPGFLVLSIAKGNVPSCTSYPELGPEDPLWEILMGCWTFLPGERASLVVIRRDIMACGYNMRHELPDFEELGFQTPKLRQSPEPLTRSPDNSSECRLDDGPFSGPVNSLSLSLSALGIESSLSSQADYLEAPNAASSWQCPICKAGFTDALDLAIHREQHLQSGEVTVSHKVAHQQEAYTNPKYLPSPTIMAQGAINGPAGRWTSFRDAELPHSPGSSPASVGPDSPTFGISPTESARELMGPDLTALTFNRDNPSVGRIPNSSPRSPRSPHRAVSDTALFGSPGGIGPSRRRGSGSGTGYERSNSLRSSPYLRSPRTTPNASPCQSPEAGYNSLPDISANRRLAEGSFVCPAPNCGYMFTRHVNLRAHLRAHKEERPFKCKWSGCERGFMRPHDLKRHEALPLSVSPHICEGCQKTFSRIDALNRHLNSEDGIDCQDIHESPAMEVDDHACDVDDAMRYLEIGSEEAAWSGPLFQ